MSLQASRVYIYYVLGSYTSIRRPHVCSTDNNFWPIRPVYSYFQKPKCKCHSIWYFDYYFISLKSVFARVPTLKISRRRIKNKRVKLSVKCCAYFFFSHSLSLSLSWVWNFKVTRTIGSFLAAVYYSIFAIRRSKANSLKSVTAKRLL